MSSIWYISVFLKANLPPLYYLKLMGFQSNLGNSNSFELIQLCGSILQYVFLVRDVAGAKS